MKVIVAAAGTWHAPHLAYQLERLDMLDTLISTTPANRLRTRANLRREHSTWLPYPELVGPRVARRLHLSPVFNRAATSAHAHTFDWLVTQYLRRRRPDIFVVFARFGLHGIEYCRAEQIVSIVERGSCHVQYRADILREEHERLGLPYVRSSDAHLVKRELREYHAADYVAVPSTLAADSFIARGHPRHKILQIAYGVNTVRFAPGSKRSNDPVFQVLCVGNLGIEKGVRDLVDAMNQLDERTTELLLIGSLDPIARRTLADLRIPWRFLGAVSQSELAAHYQRASAFCLLSIQEGMSMALMEALASGLPVVASEHTGIRDLVTDGDDGFIVPIRSPQIAAERLRALQQSEEMRVEMGKRARATMTRYTWDQYGERVRRAYEHVVAVETSISSVSRLVP